MSSYQTISTYHQNRQFGESPVITTHNENLCITNPSCAPSFETRSRMNDVRRQLYAPVDRTFNKDVWGEGSCCRRQRLLQTELDQGWTVFQRRTFTRTPVLWIHEAPSHTDEEES